MAPPVHPRRVAGGFQDGQVAIEEALRLQCAASPDARLVQVCLVDHSGPNYAQPHLHIQLMFSDRSRSPWLHMPGCNIMSLRQSVNRLQVGSRAVRLHLHEDEADKPPSGGPASEMVVSALPRLTLGSAGAAHLNADAHEACAICLSSFEESEELIVMPCSGTHVAHAECMKR